MTSSSHSQWGWPRITLVILFRILLVTGLFTLMAFAIGLFVGIMTMVVRSWITGAADFTLAYRHFGLPAAFLGMFAGLVGMLVIEIRQLRRPHTRIVAH